VALRHGHRRVRGREAPRGLRRPDRGLGAELRSQRDRRSTPPDFGITGGKDSGIIYAKGQPLKKVSTEDLVEELFEEIDKYYAAGKKVVVDDDQAAEAARWLSENEDETAI
jgi:hypothetical protein